MAIVTMSYEIDTAGLEIGRLLARRLGYRYVSFWQLLEAARRLRLAAARPVQVEPDLPQIERFELKSRQFELKSRQYVVSIRAALCGFAQDDDVVVVAPRGESILHGVPHALRVRIVRPFPDSLDLGDLHDVVISGERMIPTTAVDVLSDLVRRRELMTTDAGIQLVGDRTLASTVELSLAMNAMTRRYAISVAAAQGVVRLDAPEILDEAVEVAREVSGVRRVVMYVASTRQPFDGRITSMPLPTSI